jgi:hypothetical protein
VQLVDANVLLYEVNPPFLSTTVRAHGSTARRPAPSRWDSHAAAVVGRRLGQPSTVVVHPTARRLDLLQGLPGEIVSFDRDFQRFPGVRSSVP